MAGSSVPPTVWTAAPGQLERHWQKAFRQRFQVLPPQQWRCVGIDIGKYEHVAVMSDGLGQVVAAPIRFGIRESISVRERRSFAPLRMTRVSCVAALGRAAFQI